jgi:hypothetical protein
MNRFRINVIEALQQIASKSNQIDAYEAAEKAINVPDVLLKDWERVYRPELDGFEESFTKADLQQLNCFTDFFLARINSLPDSFNELLKDPCWNSICEFAGQILEDFAKSGAHNRE